MPQFTLGARQIPFTHIAAKLFAPTPICSFVDKCFRATFPEGTAQRHRGRGILFHIAERTVKQDGRHGVRCHVDVKKGRDAADLAGKIAFEIGKVDQFHVGKVAQRPPATDIFPIGPERRAAIVQPAAISAPFPDRVPFLCKGARALGIILGPVKDVDGF